VETLIGPAGTGKSFVVGALAKAWQDPDRWDGEQRRVVALAASQVATEVLIGEGLAARNIARWLATQDRLTDGRPFGDDKAWRLRAGDLVAVDESAMADTAALARIHAVCAGADAKLLLVGDHRQLAAVGAAGGMELVANTANPGNPAAGGLRHELTETRRFSADWEGCASLRLRDGDQTVLADYHKYGRLIDGGALEQTEQAAVRAWLADTLAGRHALLIVDTNEQAARLSAQLRADLVRLGHVDEHAVPLGLQGTWAGRGDLVQARRNAWELVGVGANTRGPINREQYRVLHTLDDGGLVVAPITGRTTGTDDADDAGGCEQLGAALTLPPSYVAEHVALGYASTVHAAQGLTVDTCHTVATAATGVEALYVGMTRGRTPTQPTSSPAPCPPTRRPARSSRPCTAPRKPSSRPRSTPPTHSCPHWPKRPQAPPRPRPCAPRPNCSPTRPNWPPRVAPPAGSTNWWPTAPSPTASASTSPPRTALPP
jgi:hypothetical protein